MLLRGIRPSGVAPGLVYNSSEFLEEEKNENGVCSPIVSRHDQYDALGDHLLGPSRICTYNITEGYRRGKEKSVPMRV